MTPSVSRSGVAVQGVNAPLWRKPWKHAIGGRAETEDRAEDRDGQTADRAEGGDSSAAVRLSPPFG